MKHVIFSIALLVSVSTSNPLSANHSRVPDKAEQSFMQSFPHAELVRWSKEGEYSKATFIIYGKAAQALFNTNGELIGSVRNIWYSDLPIKVMISIKKRFNNATPFALTEINRLDGTQYKFNIEEGNQRYLAIVSPDGSFSKVTLQ